MKIDFEFDTPYGKFGDALYFADEAVPSDSEVEALKQERLNNWLVVVTPPLVEEI